MAKKKAVKKKAAKKKAVKKKSITRGGTIKGEITSGPDSDVLPRFYDGQSVFLAGTFSWPSKADVTKFLRGEGAKIASKITDKLDVLLIGGGRTAKAKKDVEKLNKAGAGIQILDDLKQLVPMTLVLTPEILGDRKAYERFCSLSQCSWIEFDTTEGEVFDGITVPALNEHWIRQTGFDNCTFSNCKLNVFNIGGSYWSRSGNCVVRDSVLNEVRFGRVENMELRNLTGSGFVLCLNKGTMSNVKVDECEFDGLENVEIDSCKFDVKFDGGGSPAKCSLRKTQLTAIKGEKVDFTECEVSDTKMSAAEVDEFKFTKCKLKKLTIDGLKAKTFEFHDCEIAKVELINCEAQLLGLGGSKVTSLSTKGCKFAAAGISDEQKKKIKGLPEVRSIPNASTLNHLQQLADAYVKSDKLSVEVKGTRTGGGKVNLEAVKNWSLRFQYKSPGDKQHQNQFDVYHWDRKVSKTDVVNAFLRLVVEADVADIDAGSLKTKTSKCPLKPKELKQLIVNAIYEAIGKEPQSEEEVAKAQKEARASSAKSRKELLDLINAGDVKKINKFTAAQRKQIKTVKGVDCSGKNLAKVNLSELALNGADFSGADLSDANLTSMNLGKANLSGANLSKAKLSFTGLRGADLSNANLTGANLKGVDYADAKFDGTVFKGATVTHICGLDLRKADLTGLPLAGVSYDEKTQLPKSVKVADMKKMSWLGGGIPPHERKQNKKASGPIDFEQFMERLNEITDQSRLKKSMKMLKADSFELFSEVTDTSVTGVVKSQSDANLVYSCTLDSDGKFMCCTQNLNPCGGLRGALCKHILVLIVGLAKSDQLDPTAVDEWVNASKLNQPELDKDAMSEVLLKYKGAEAGEIDWRPTETVPEDFFAF